MAFKDTLIRFLEAVLPGGGAVPGQADPFREAYGQTIDADDDQWRKLSGDSKRDLSPMTQDRMQRMAHFLWEQNLLANRLIELPVAYMLAEGVRLTVEDEDSQKLLDRFWRDPINDMDIKLPKKLRELSLFGEQCYPAFVNDLDGMVRIGYLDPATISKVMMDPDNPEQPIGVITRKNKQGQSRRYRVIINGPEDVFTQRTQAIRQSFTDGEAFYFRVNDLSSGTRGRSDLLAQADWLDAYDQFMFSELERYGFLRAFIWDVTLKGATPEEVVKRAKDITTPKPGSVRVHNDSEEWAAEAPDLKAVDTAAGARLFRNHVLGGATMPEHWFGGGGDVNRAVGAEMSEPTFKVYSMRQRFAKHMLESIGRYVLMRGVGARGELRGQVDWSDPKYVVVAEFPELSAKDTSKYAASLAHVVAAVIQAIAQKILSRETGLEIINSMSSRLGVEIDANDELKKAEAEAGTIAEGDVFNNPPAGEDPQGEDGSAAMTEAVDLLRAWRDRSSEDMRALAASLEEARREGNMDRFMEALTQSQTQSAASVERLVEALGETVHRHEVEFTLRQERARKEITLPSGEKIVMKSEPEA